MDSQMVGYWNTDSWADLLLLGWICSTMSMKAGSRQLWHGRHQHHEPGFLAVSPV